MTFPRKIYHPDDVERTVSVVKTAGSLERAAQTLGTSVFHVRRMLAQAGLPLSFLRPERLVSQELALENAAALYRQGATLAEAARICDCSSRALRERCFADGILRPKGLPPKKSRNGALLAEWRQGASMAAIARRAGLSRERVRQIVAAARIEAKENTE